MSFAIPFYSLIFKWWLPVHGICKQQKKNFQIIIINNSIETATTSNNNKQLAKCMLHFDFLYYNKRNDDDRSLFATHFFPPSFFS